MPLHLRIRHALGESTHSLDDREIDDPHYVGRAKTATVHVPSMAVSSTHAAVFLHDGRWVIQDAGSRAGTFVNGMRTAQPVVLARGDVITLGREADAATVRVLAIHAADADALMDATAVAPEDPEAADDDDNIFAATAAPGFVVGGPIVPRPRQQNTGGKVAVGVVAVLLIASAIGAVWYFARQEKEAARRAAVPPAPTSAPARVDGSKPRLFTPTAGGSQPVPRQAMPRRESDAPTAAGQPGDVTVPRPTDQAAEPATPTDPAAPPLDPVRDDPAFVRVIDAAKFEQPEKALTAFLDYKSTHADSPVLTEIDGMIETSLDQLWWKRISQIFSQRVRNAEALGVMATERAAAGSAQEREVIDRQIQRLKSENESIVTELTVEMAYKAAAPPDPDAPADLDGARKNRDAKIYADWKARVLSSMSRRRGALPWG